MCQAMQSQYPLTCVEAPEAIKGQEENALQPGLTLF